MPHLFGVCLWQTTVPFSGDATLPEDPGRLRDPTREKDGRDFAPANSLFCASLAGPFAMGTAKRIHMDKEIQRQFKGLLLTEVVPFANHIPQRSQDKEHITQESTTRATAIPQNERQERLRVTYQEAD